MTTPRQFIRIPNDQSKPLSNFQRERAQRFADHCGVSVEHFIDIVRKRRIARLNRMYRRRSRQKLNPKRRALTYPVGRTVTMQGEGELEPLLRAVGMKQQQFLELAGIGRTAFYMWYGHPLYKWPVELVRYYAWANNMAAELLRRGVDPEKFKPVIPTERPRNGVYPRTPEQVAAFVLEPEAKNARR